MTKASGSSKTKCGELSRRMLLVLIAAASMNHIDAQGVGTSVEPCPNAEGVTGYSTVDALNIDMMAELEKIRAGDPPEEPYMFELCPNTVFDMSLTQLTPLLSGSVFSCGSAAAPGKDCNFTGGVTQVLIEDPVDVPGYDLEMVSFVGISFLGFTGSAISGGAGPNTTVGVLNSMFADFSAMFAVSQQHPSGQKPFKVQVSESEISTGIGGAVFSNVGGELTLEGVSVTDSAFATVVSTGTAAQSGEGSTFLRSVAVSNSDIVDVFSTMGSGDIDAVDVTVSNMGSFETVFDVVGEGSTAMVMNLLIEDNDFTSIVPPIRWTAITVRDSASGTFIDTVVLNSTNIRHVFSASGYSSLDIRRVEMTDLTGGRAVDTLDASALFFANIESMITVSRIVVDKTDLFTSVFFGNDGSFLDISDSCLLSGSNQAAVYMSEDSNYTAISNFIDPSFTSSVCPEEGLRLVVEKVDSGCFEVNRTDCAFDCMPFFDAGNCTALVSEAPSVAPSSITGPPAFLETESPVGNDVTSTPNSTASPAGTTTSSVPTQSAQPSVAPSYSLAPSVTTVPTSLLKTTAPIPVTGTTTPVIPVPASPSTGIPITTGSPDGSTTAGPVVAPITVPTPATVAPDGSTLSPVQRETTAPAPISNATSAPSLIAPTSKPICDYCKSSKTSKSSKGKAGLSKKSSPKSKSQDEDCYCPSKKSSKGSKGKGSVRHHTNVYEAIEGLDERR